MADEYVKISDLDVLANGTGSTKFEVEHGGESYQLDLGAITRYAASVIGDGELVLSSGMLSSGGTVVQHSSLIGKVNITFLMVGDGYQPRADYTYDSSLGKITFGNGRTVVAGSTLYYRFKATA